MLGTGGSLCVPFPFPFRDSTLFAFPLLVVVLTQMMPWLVLLNKVNRDTAEYLEVDGSVPNRLWKGIN